MTVTFVAGANGKANNTAPKSVVPATCVTDDIVLIHLSENAADAITATPAPLNLIDTNSFTSTFPGRLYWARVNGSTVIPGGTFTWTLSATRAWATVLYAARGVDTTSPIHGFQPGAAATSPPVMPSLTTTLPAWLVELVAGKSNGTIITGFTAPSGWTVRQTTAAFSTFSGAAAVADRDAGTAAAGTYGGETYTPSSATGAYIAYVVALLPAVTVVNGSVTAVAAAANGAGVAPGVTGETDISGGGPAAATALAVAPVVSVGSSIGAVPAAASASAVAPTVGTGVGVAPPAASATSTAVAPAVTGAASVAAARAVASSAAIAPAVSGGSTRQAVASTATSTAVAPSVAGSATVAAVAAHATAAAPTPTVQTTSAGIVLAVAATATASAPPPTVTGQSASTVSPPRATASATAPAPTIQWAYTVTATRATSSAAAPSPAVAGGATVTVTVATSTATAPAPTVTGAAGAVVQAVAAVATASAPAPLATTGALVAAIVATALAEALSPSVTGLGVAGPTPPERIVTVAAELRTRTIDAESRLLAVPAEVRTRRTAAETRSTVIPPDPRTEVLR